MEVKIISKECIKPSTPTPPNLKTYKLSLLDQCVSSAYVPMVLFFPMNQNVDHSITDIISQRRELLTQSLSETLTRFYPFAGKIKDSLSIDCNDDGVEYLEACVNCHLFDCLNQPNLESFVKFVPREASWKEAIAGDHVAMVQVNSFACGGIAIGVLVSHLIADGTAFSVFVKGWAATCRKTSEALCANFEAPSIFIQNEAFHRDATSLAALSKHFLKTGKCTSRRIVFSASAIELLKAKATSTSVQNPTRVEVVSALLWKCITAASQAKSGIKRPSLITQAINLRPRSIPPFKEFAMGNIFWPAIILCTDEELAALPYRVSKMREAITKINADFVKNLQGDKGLPELCELLEVDGAKVSSTVASHFGVDCIGCSSWCNFGMYDIDFGLGKPIWVVTSVGSDSDNTEHQAFFNAIILMDTRSAGGVEAWVRLSEGEMAMLGQDKELLAFASLDPSPMN